MDDNWLSYFINITKLIIIHDNVRNYTRKISIINILVNDNFLIF